jgi:hypothetical protein
MQSQASGDGAFERVKLRLCFGGRFERVSPGLSSLPS